jgi:hypothetical protein
LDKNHGPWTSPRFKTGTVPGASGALMRKTVMKTSDLTIDIESPCERPVARVFRRQAFADADLAQSFSKQRQSLSLSSLQKVSHPFARFIA